MALARPTEPYPDPSWSGWGDPSLKPALPDDVLELMTATLGIRDRGRPTGSITELTLPSSRIDPAVAAALGEAVGADNVLAESEARLRHMRGKSLTDLLRLRERELGGAPDLVVLPGSHEQVLEALRICSAERIAVVPFGGGTSVVGGLEPAADGFAGVVALDLRRMNALLELDEQSRLAVLEPGLRGARGRAAAQRARLHDRPLPAVVRVPHARRRRGDALERPGLAGLRALRRTGARYARGRSCGDDRARTRAEVGRGPRPAPAAARVRGSARGDHRG